MQLLHAGSCWELLHSWGLMARLEDYLGVVQSALPLILTMGSQGWEPTVWRCIQRSIQKSAAGTVLSAHSQTGDECPTFADVQL